MSHTKALLRSEDAVLTLRRLGGRPTLRTFLRFFNDGDSPMSMTLMVTTNEKRATMTFSELMQLKRDVNELYSAIVKMFNEAPSYEKVMKILVRIGSNQEVSEQERVDCKAKIEAFAKSVLGQDFTTNIFDCGKRFVSKTQYCVDSAVDVGDSLLVRASTVTVWKMLMDDAGMRFNSIKSLTEEGSDYSKFMVAFDALGFLREMIDKCSNSFRLCEECFGKGEYHVCSQCKRAWYCSKECQHKAWVETHRHMGCS